MLVISDDKSSESQPPVTTKQQHTVTVDPTPAPLPDSSQRCQTFLSSHEEIESDHPSEKSKMETQATIDGEDINRVIESIAK